MALCQLLSFAPIESVESSGCKEMGSHTVRVPCAMLVDCGADAVVDGLARVDRDSSTWVSAMTTSPASSNTPLMVTSGMELSIGDNGISSRAVDSSVLFIGGCS